MQDWLQCDFSSTNKPHFLHIYLICTHEPKKLSNIAPKNPEKAINPASNIITSLEHKDNNPTEIDAPSDATVPINDIPPLIPFFT